MRGVGVQAPSLYLEYHSWSPVLGLLSTWSLDGQCHVETRPNRCCNFVQIRRSCESFVFPSHILISSKMIFMELRYGVIKKKVVTIFVICYYRRVESKSVGELTAVSVMRVVIVDACVRFCIVKRTTLTTILYHYFSVFPDDRQSIKRK